MHFSLLDTCTAAVYVPSAWQSVTQPALLALLLRRGHVSHRLAFTRRNPAETKGLNAQSALDSDIVF